MTITKGSKALVEEAMAQVKTHRVADMRARLGRADPGSPYFEPA